jgi:DNA segregation ATPase FtsK/SpoIIIE-like protein
MFSERAGEAGLEPLPLVLVIVDEVADIALQCGLNSVFYKNLIRLSSKGAAFGLIMILATQNPKAEVLNTLIRGNMSTRVAFRVNSIEHSRTILGCSGAQHLPRTIRGRLVARLDESLVHLQGYYVPDEDVLALTRRWAGNAAPALAPVERALVRFACAELAGGFPVHRLYEQFKGEISYRQIVALARRWEGCGWLLPAPSAVEPRQVSDELRALGTQDGER